MGTIMRILLVEDDKGASRFIKKGLSESGYVVDAVYDGEEGLHLGQTQSYDLIVLDVMLPELSGFEVLKTLRKKGKCTPVIILTARDAREDVVHGLDLGADDYLVKPFAFAELLARIRAVLRRGQKEQEVTAITVDTLTLNILSHAAEREGHTIELSAREYQLLEYLMRNSGQVLTRTMILEQVWGYDFDTGSNVIDVHINRLRSKVDKGFDVRLIHTIKGVGYVLKV